MRVRIVDIVGRSARVECSMRGEEADKHCSFHKKIGHN